MPLENTIRPTWLTFDCYGTLIQWDEGLMAAVEQILVRRAMAMDPQMLIGVYDRHEHELEQTSPHRSFRAVAGMALQRAMDEVGLRYEEDDVDLLTTRISEMPPFPDVVPALAALKRAGFRLCIISNTDDAIIAGNVAQLGGHIDRVITAEQAQAYKPSGQIFEHAYRELGITRDEVVHICASPHLDHVAARELGFRCVWVDRGSGRKLLPDYRPDAIVPRLDVVPPLFAGLQWI
ncbi:MAG TPA: haloacid dehalogenase type II [Terriglobales bacterium]|nr:haloacid dehalogenase type II [Terriglobales bacterium]